MVKYYNILITNSNDVLYLFFAMLITLVTFELILVGVIICRDVYDGGSNGDPHCVDFGRCSVLYVYLYGVKQSLQGH